MQRSPFGWINSRRGFFFSLLLGLVGGLSALPRLLTYSDPTGLNGYFYLKQTKTLAASGTFYFSDHSLAFLPLVLLRWLVSTDLLAFQLGIALALSAAFACVAWLVDATPLGAREKWAAKLALLIALFSSSFFSEFSLGFYKNLVAEVLLLAAANLLVRGRGRWGALCFVAAFLTHKSVALVGFLFLGLLALERCWQVLTARAQWKRELLGLALLGTVGILLGGVFLYHFPKAHAFLGFALRSFSGPVPKLEWFASLFSVRPSRGLELLGWLLLFFTPMAAWRFLPHAWRLVSVTVCLLALVALHPFQPAGPASLGYRFTLMLPLLMVVLALTPAFLPNRWLRFTGVGILLLASALSFAPLGFSARAVRREVRPYSEMAPRVGEIRGIVFPEDHLVSHHGMEFYVDYVTDIRSRSFLAAPDFNGRKYRIAFLPRARLSGEARDDLEQIQLLDLGGGYTLVDEEDWQIWIGLHEAPRSWKNAIGERPAHVYE